MLASIISNAILISIITRRREGEEGWDRLKRDNTTKIIRSCDYTVLFRLVNKIFDE